MKNHSGIHQLFMLTFISTMMLMLWGCDTYNRQEIDLQKYVAKIKSKPVPPIEPIPELSYYSPYTYPKMTRRSPFRPVIKHLSGQAPNKERPRQDLELFPLDSLKMVGVLKENEKIWAIIKAPDGKIHRAKKGDYLGQQYGKIVSISISDVKLVEIIPVHGGWENRPATLALGDEKE